MGAVLPCFLLFFGKLDLLLGKREESTTGKLDYERQVFRREPGSWSP